MRQREHASHRTEYDLDACRFRSVPAGVSAVGPVGRHVIDRSGVKDEFIIRLEFHPDDNTPGIKWPPERDADTSVPQAASIFTALEQQLGVKLEKVKAPREFLVIDYIEKPKPELPSPHPERP